MQYVQLFAQYKQSRYSDLLTNNTRRSWSWILLRQYYLFITTRHRYVFFCIYKAQNSVRIWHRRMEDCLPFHSWNLPFHSGIFHIPYQNFRSIPYQDLLVDSLLLLLLLLLHFTLTIVASLKIRKPLILKKLLPLPAPSQHFRFQVRFRF